jgi:hypothetical protein
MTTLSTLFRSPSQISGRSRALLAVLFLSTSSLVACGSGGGGADPKTPDEKQDDPLVGAPNWVLADCRDHFADQAVICGVGSVTGVSSASLARNTSMARGRTEISRYLSTEVKSVLRDYQGASEGKNEQEIEERSTQISEMTLSGSRMAGHFRAKDGTHYALMVLELDSFKQSIEASSSIDEELKRALMEHANTAFSVRDSEVSRY